MRIVVIRPGALGDTLLTFPALGWLRRAFPDAHLTLIARPDILPLARASRLADATFSYDLPQWSTLFTPELARSGLAFDTLTGAEAVIAWLRDVEGLLAGNMVALGVERVVIAPGKPDDEANESFGLTLTRALTEIGIEPPKTTQELLAALPPLFPPEEDAAQAEGMWERLGLHLSGWPVVALHPGAGSGAKRWDAERFAALARALSGQGMTPLLLEGPLDGEQVRSVAEAMGSAPLVARDLSIGELAALIRRCMAFVGNDSGVTHLAGLLGIPTLALFGPTDATVWKPLGTWTRVRRATTGQTMEQLQVEDALGALMTLLRDAYEAAGSTQE